MSKFVHEFNLFSFTAYCDANKKKWFMSYNILKLRLFVGGNTQD